MSEEQQHRLALPRGTRIRDFEFHRVLGHGGFGITYLGRNVTLDIPVAIKEYFPADLATRERNLSVVPQTDQAAPSTKPASSPASNIPPSCAFTTSSKPTGRPISPWTTWRERVCPHI